jgi:hypothetical protein
VTEIADKIADAVLRQGSLPGGGTTLSVSLAGPCGRRRLRQVVRGPAVLFGNVVAVGIERQRKSAVPQPLRHLHEVDALSQLTRTAALSAILSGAEAITRELLDATVIDHAAESTTPHPHTSHAG